MNIDITINAQVSKVGARVVVLKDSGLITRICKMVHKHQPTNRRGRKVEAEA